MPIIAYRGQHGKGDNLETRKGSLSFSAEEQVAIEYAKHPNNSNEAPIEPKVFKAELPIVKPFIESEDCFIELKEIFDKLGAEEMKRMALKFEELICVTDNWKENYKHQTIQELIDSLPASMKQMHDLYFQTYHLFDDPEEVQKLKAKGYDSATYAGSGVGMLTREYRIFEPIANPEKIRILDKYFV